MSSAQGIEGQGVGLPPWLARRPSMNPKLIVVDGEATKNEIMIRLPMTIGRIAGNGLVISHPLISRKHCEIYKRDDWLYVRDFDSANGTFVNDQQVQGEMILKPGDRLTVGPLTFITVYQQNKLPTPRELAKQVAQETEVGKTRRSDSAIARDEGGSNDGSAFSSDDALQPSPAAQQAPAARPKRKKSRDELDTLPLTTGTPSSDDDAMGDVFAAWAKTSAGDEVDDLVDRLEKETSSGDLRDEEDVLGDDGDVLASDAAANTSQGSDAGLTLLHDQAKKEQKDLGPVQLEDPDARDSEGSDDIDGIAAPNVVVLFHLINQCDRLQRQMLEHYQEAVIAAEMASRMQQAQLDLVRQEMDRLHQLTGMLQGALVKRHPEMQMVPKQSGKIPEFLSNEIVELSKPQFSIEQFHSAVRQRLAEMQKLEEQRWGQVRQYFRDHDVT